MSSGPRCPVRLSKTPPKSNRQSGGLTLHYTLNVKTQVCNMSIQFHVEFHKRKDDVYARDSECFTVRCGEKPSFMGPAIEKADVSDEEILAHVQEIMRTNGWEILISIERVVSESRTVYQAPDEIVTCPCGNRFPASERFAHYFGVNYCSDICYDKRPPIEEVEGEMPPHLRE